MALHRKTINHQDSIVVVAKQNLSGGIFPLLAQCVVCWWWTLNGLSHGGRCTAPRVCTPHVLGGCQWNACRHEWPRIIIIVVVKQKLQATTIRLLFLPPCSDPNLCQITTLADVLLFQESHRGALLLSGMCVYMMAWEIAIRISKLHGTGFTQARAFVCGSLFVVAYLMNGYSRFADFFVSHRRRLLISGTRVPTPHASPLDSSTYSHEFLASQCSYWRIKGNSLSTHSSSSLRTGG